MSNRYHFPSTRFIRWFIQDQDNLNQEIRLRLLMGPFSSRSALAAAGLNTLVVCSVAVMLHPTIFFISWLVADLVIWIIRWFLLQKFIVSGESRSHYATDLALLFGLIWAVEIGIGTAGCIISVDPVLQVLACTSAVSMNGAIAMRNQGIPRYAFTQILLTDIPMKLATLFQPAPLLRILMLQAPMYLTGLWLLLNQLNTNLIKAYIAEFESIHSATHDKLTGALNRLGIVHIVAATLDSTEAQSVETSILYLDLDGFKKINDENGHATGDRVLVSFSNMITGMLRKSDAVARMGGDEFIVFMPGTNEASASLIAERIIEKLRVYTAQNKAYAGLGVSIGIATNTSLTTESLDQLLSRADFAMYAAKSAGKNCYKFG